MECCGRPNRSDAHLSKEEATKIEGETREYFDGLAPRRHAKPQRSDYSSHHIDAAVSNAQDGDIPEYLQFKHLEKDSQCAVCGDQPSSGAGELPAGREEEKSCPPELPELSLLLPSAAGALAQKLVYNGSQVPEEFVETEYYKDLTGIDKQHHTTGTGFIKMENTSNVPLGLASDSTTDLHASCKGNPATNDWIPASSDMANFISDKPSRSDN